MPKKKTVSDRVVASKKKVTEDRVVQLIGTGPLSFEMKIGTTLAIRKILPSNSSRPTIGSGFKTSGYVVYNGITKVGRINPKDTEVLNEQIPTSGKVVEVNGERSVLRIKLPKIVGGNAEGSGSVG